VNNGDQAVDFLYLLGCLALVGSAFMVRRIPIATGLKMALGWMLIFGAFFVAFTLKDDFLALGRRVFHDTSSNGQEVSDGGEVRIRKSLDGHFWVNAEVNGTSVRFLVDSGATTTSMSTEAAREARVEAAGGMPVIVETANGTVSAQRGLIAHLQVGSIERRDLGVQMSEAFGDMNVLGMNFLSSLSGWGVEGQTLVLKP
jgi:aspartyl protease family protein